MICFINPSHTPMHMESRFSLTLNSYLVIDGDLKVIKNSRYNHETLSVLVKFIKVLEGYELSKESRIALNEVLDIIKLESIWGELINSSIERSGNFICI